MADKQYTLNFKMYDGTTQSVNFTVPQGDAGPKGEKGDPGEKGIQGMKGDPGADGYTPVKGKDYYTEADKTEMVNAVLAALPEAEGVGY